MCFADRGWEEAVDTLLKIVGGAIVHFFALVSKVRNFSACTIKHYQLLSEKMSFENALMKSVKKRY